MFTQLLAKSSAKRAGESLYQSATRQARTPVLYLDMGTPDTIEGRFELLTLHVILLIDRLKDVAGQAAAETRQALFDTYVSNLDGALREMGVGDLAVGKRMRKLGEAFYGRASAFQAGIAAMPDRGELHELLRRTVYQEKAADGVAALADYLMRCRDSLRDCAPDALLAGRPAWPAS